MTITAEYLDRLNELAANETFYQKLTGVTEREEIRALFASEGVALDDGMMDVIMQKVNNAISGELDEDMLEAVTGGCKGCFGIGLLAGLYAASGGAAAAVAVGIGVWIGCSIVMHSKKKKR